MKKKKLLPESLFYNLVSRDRERIDKLRVTKFIHDFGRKVLFVFGNEKYCEDFLENIMIDLFKFTETSLKAIQLAH